MRMEDSLGKETQGIQILYRQQPQIYSYISIPPNLRNLYIIFFLDHDPSVDRNYDLEQGD